ncbi:MAG TPA: hypothetical protein VIU93_14480 [Gallionellaceae bacterium]
MSQDVARLIVPIGLILAAIFVLIPSVPRVERVRFTSEVYKWSLVAVLSTMLLYSLVVFSLTFNIRALEPVILQGTLLLMIYHEYKHTRVLIKLWCSMLIVSAVLGLMSLYYADEIKIPVLADNVISLAVGMIFLVWADRYVQIIFDGYDKPPGEQQ